MFSVFTGWSVFPKRTGTHLGDFSETTPALSAGIFWSNRRRLQRDDCCRPDRRHSPSLRSVPGQWPLCSSLTYTILTLPPLSRIHSLTLSQTQNLWPNHDGRYLAFTQKTFSQGKKPVLMKPGENRRSTWHKTAEKTTRENNWFSHCKNSLKGGLLVFDGFSWSPRQWLVGF